MLGSGDVSLTIVITSVSSSESLESFTNRFFHMSRPPGFRNTFDAVKRNGRFGRIRVREVKRAAAEEREIGENSFAEGQRESK